MKLMTTTVVAACVLALGTTAFAAGQNGTRAQVKAGTGISATTVKPADSQRRDGSFATTGITANGATVRPANGKGVMDGTGLNR